MKKFLLFVFIFSFSFVNLAIAETSLITKVVFTNQERIVAPSDKSEDITIQWQDDNNTPQGLTESGGKLNIQSTSESGVFVSCTTGIAVTDNTSITLNKGWKNKNICYKDSTKGIFDINAIIIVGGKNFSTSQKITITSVSTPPTDDSGTTTSTTTATTTVTTSTSTTTNTNTTTSTNNSGSSYYVYSSSVSLSTYEPLSLNVEAGRERLGFLHTPLEFKSYTKDKKTGKNISGAKYLWTFGDGTSGEGEEIVHTYLFPGVYNVVLNSSVGNEDAVDITKVKIIEPEVSTSLFDSYVELINKKSTDLNIGGWKIKGKNKEYVIPKDTIISSNGGIKISSNVLGSAWGGEKISLVYPDNQIAFEVVKISEDEKQKQIFEISQKLVSIKNELDNKYPQNFNYTEFAEQTPSGDDAKKILGENKGENMASSISAPATKSVVSKIFDFFATMFK